MNEDSIVRVRFAPSPTGYLHLGGMRTALFNYLYARSTGGKLILRIEDTDRSRLVEGALENLLEIFAWLGIDFDEGPHIGGGFAPYVQSERADIYRKYADELIAEGNAYRCFCAKERLDEVRQAQITAGKPPMYDRRCREISIEESRRRSENEKFVVRLKIPLEGEIRFKDGVRGYIAFDAGEIDDQVLLKSDGYPTYHLANVVDDHLMEISDVIRGEEWVPSTPKHIHLYRCLGWEPPRFHHLPLLLNPDRSKLSKRQGDAAVEDYRAKVFLPEALINYSALLGWHPSDDREFFSRDDLIKEFSLERVTKAGAVFDIGKLTWLNRRHLNAMSEEKFLTRAGDNIPDEMDFSSDVGKRVLKSIREGLERFSDIPEKLKPFNWNWEGDIHADVRERLESETAQKVYRSILEQRGEIKGWDTDAFKELMKAVGKAAEVKGKDLWMAVRAAATGSLHGPEMTLVADYLGKERFFYHIGKAVVSC